MFTSLLLAASGCHFAKALAHCSFLRYCHNHPFTLSIHCQTKLLTPSSLSSVTVTRKPAPVRLQLSLLAICLLNAAFLLFINKSFSLSMLRTNHQVCYNMCIRPYKRNSQVARKPEKFQTPLCKQLPCPAGSVWLSSEQKPYAIS